MEKVHCNLLSTIIYAINMEFELFLGKIVYVRKLLFTMNSHGNKINIQFQYVPCHDKNEFIIIESIVIIGN